MRHGARREQGGTACPWAGCRTVRSGDLRRRASRNTRPAVVARRLRDFLRPPASRPPVCGGRTVPAVLAGGQGDRRRWLMRARCRSRPGRSQASPERSVPRWRVVSESRAPRSADPPGSEPRFRELDGGPRRRRPAPATFRPDHRPSAETRSPARDASTSGCRRRSCASHVRSNPEQVSAEPPAPSTMTTILSLIIQFHDCIRLDTVPPCGGARGSGPA